MLDVLIIGAGPFGLSIAAHAKKVGLHYLVIGEPMDFWLNKMPNNMYMRTAIEYTGLSDPDNQYTIYDYEKEKNLNLSYPMPRKFFVDYAFWFIKKTGIEIEKDYVKKLTKKENGFIVQTNLGNIYEATNVVVAVGLTNAQYIPKPLTSLSKEFITHSSSYTEFNRFENKNVLVLGGGQSAWETAALLHQAGANTLLSYRRKGPISPPKNGNATQHFLADKFYYYPVDEKKKLRSQFEKPTVSDFLKPMVEGKVIQYPNTIIRSYELTKDNMLHLYFNKKSVIVDHLIAATGYRYLPNNFDFLQPMLNNLKLESDGTPKTNQEFQSSIHGLYFAGAATAYTHGPTFRFIAGVWHTSETIIKALKV